MGEGQGDSLKNAIYQPLECLGGVLKPKGHAGNLQESKGSDKGCVGDVCRCDGDLVVATNQI